MKTTPRIPHGWQSQPLSSVANIIGGGTPSTTDPAYWNGAIPWATPTDITALTGRYIAQTEKTITDAGLSNSGARLLPPQSLLMTSRATIGKCAINTVPMATNQGFASLVCNNKLLVDYAYYLITSHRHELSRLASGSTFIELSKKTFQDFAVLVPPVEEQQKIATILASVDNAIERTQSLIAQLGRVKQALLRNIVCRGLPGAHQRFRKIKDLGEIPNDWTAVNLGDIAEKVTSGSRGWAEYYADEGKLFLRITNLTRDSITPDLSDVRYVTPPQGAEGSRTKVQAGDLLVSITADLGIIGRIPEGYPEAYINQHIALVRLKPGAATPDWVALFLASPVGQIQFQRLNDPGAKAGLNLESIRRLTVVLPSLAEQQRIAALINGTDQAIANEKSILEQLKIAKSGLIHVLLSGKKRVPISTPHTRTA